MKKIVILRGVPGTGKTTWGLQYYEHRKKKCPYEDIRYMSRDAYRQRLCKYDENEYLRSFDDKHWDKSIRKHFWMGISEVMMGCDLMILDMTMIDYRDIFALTWYLFKYEQEYETKVKIRWKIFLTEYGSNHNVPPEKMDRYRQMFEDSAEMVKERKLSCINGVMEESDEKWNFIV